METVKQKLKRIIAWDSDPTLSEAEIDGLLAGASLTDRGGLAPSSEEWTPTYDLNAAAMAGWLTKAARASTLTEVDPPVRASSRQKYSTIAVPWRGFTRQNEARPSAFDKRICPNIYKNK